MSKECGLIIHTSPLTTSFNGRKFHLAHGEGLGIKDPCFKFLLKIFHNKPLRMLYSAMPPSIGVGFGLKWSMSSRLGKGITKEFMGEENEDLIRYAFSFPEDEKIDYFIFGHRHLAMTFKLKNGAEIIFLGDWIKHSSYAVWDGIKLVFRLAD